MSTKDVADAHRAVQDDSRLLPPRVADQLHEFVSGAVARRDAKAIRSEAYTWSGVIALSLFDLAEAIDQATDRATEK